MPILISWTSNVYLFILEVRDKKDFALEPLDDKDQEGTFDYRWVHVLYARSPVNGGIFKNTYKAFSCMLVKYQCKVVIGGLALLTAECFAEYNAFMLFFFLLSLKCFDTIVNGDIAL